MRAVEWLDRWFRDNPEATHEEGNNALEQAKEMEKEQIIKFAIKAVTSASNEDINNPYNLEQLYNETYGSKGSDETLKDRTCNNSCSVVCGECQIFNISDDCEEVRNWDSFVEQKNKELNNQVPDVRKMVEDDVAPIDWLINQLESHIVLSAHNKLGTNRTGDYRIGLRKAIDFCHQAKEMEAKETLYTEEQVMDIVLKFAEESTFLRQGIAIKWVKNYFQSLKQPKKD